MTTRGPGGSLCADSEVCREEKAQSVMEKEVPVLMCWLLSEGAEELL